MGSGPVSPYVVRVSFCQLDRVWNHLGDPTIGLSVEVFPEGIN